jgi:hypothetical protein
MQAGKHVTHFWNLLKYENKRGNRVSICPSVNFQISVSLVFTTQGLSRRSCNHTQNSIKMRCLLWRSWLCQSSCTYSFYLPVGQIESSLGGNYGWVGLNLTRHFPHAAAACVIIHCTSLSLKCGKAPRASRPVVNNPPGCCGRRPRGYPGLIQSFTSEIMIAHGGCDESYFMLDI